MNNIIDLRSDTVTQPTEEMRKAMFEAVVGDDVSGEDPTVIKLEQKAAEMLGKEAALFVPSGTFGNQLSMFTHCTRGNEVVLSDDSHIVQHEAGGSSIIAAVQLRVVKTACGYFTWDEIDSFVRRSDDIHHPKTGLIVIQNSLGSGEVIPLEVMKTIKENAEKYEIPVHLDGARIFNAALALGVDVKDVAQFADSIMFCLSKGLCAPVGSMLVGSKSFIEAARRKRKIMGGGMRQVGVLAAPGLIALEKMSLRLKDDHAKSKKLATAFSKFDIFDINPSDVKTNIFYLKFSEKYLHIAEKFYEELKANNILIYAPRIDGVRFVTHNNVTENQIDIFIEKLPEIVKKLKNQA